MSDRGSHQHHLRRQSIPLRDLPRPPDVPDDDGRGAGDRRSFGLGRNRSLLGSRQPFRGRVNTAGRYERVVEGSPDRADANLPHITTPRNVHRPTPYDDGEVSPVNPGEFQVAMGSVGLSFENTAPAPSPGPSTTSSARRGSTLNVINETEFSNPFTSPITRVDSEEQYFSPTENDTTPLTDRRHLQPMSGVPASASTGWRHDRSKSRLGDDLPTAEAGLRPPSTYSTGSGSGHRSLSVSGSTSPLSRAGTIVRKMSQRVVNLSNEPEIVEQSIRRQPSTRQARLEGPPSFPALIEYAPNEPRTPLEKTHSTVVAVGQEPDDWPQHPNPLKGKSLGVFPPDSWLRLKLCEMLVHPFTEPIILILIFVQTIVLAIDAAPSRSRPETWKHAWINPVLLVLFIIYTLEIIARVIVSGFIKNAEDYSTVDWDLGIGRAFLNKCMNLFIPHGQQQSAGQGAGKTQQQSAGPEQSILRSFTSTQGYVDKPGHTRQQQRVRLARRAFLRHGFNRLDFVAVVSFWISFFLELFLVESNRHVYVFRMLSCLRILRLLGLTSGTSVILRSLKRATPLLVNVAFLIGFFWLLFAIVGVQSFKSSFRRSCAWFEDIDNVLTTNQSQIPYRQDSAPDRLQLCGGYINATDGGTAEPWLKADFSKGREKHKGYLCPKGSLCLEGKNPYNGTVSFDNVLQSLQLVFVIMSSNTFSDLLYYTTDADFLAGAIFFAFGIVIMSLWLMNLLVAVITSSFQVIREESKTSAFAADDEQILLPEIEEDEEPEKTERISSLKRKYSKFYWVWITIIIFGLVVQSLRSADMSPHRGKIIDITELVVTILLVFEIFLRFSSDWRNFHKSPRNWIDLALAVITAIIQIPPIHRSREVYAWLTIFQILRIYRVVLAVSLTRQLIVSHRYKVRVYLLIAIADDRSGKRHGFIEPSRFCVLDYLPHCYLCSPDLPWRIPRGRQQW